MVIAALLAATLLQTAQNPDVAEFTLDSGVSLRIERIEGAEQMGLFLFVDSGFAEDPAGKTGLAHLVEHLVMTAKTPTREAWTYRDWVRNRPSGANAMTRPRYTVYFSIGDRDALSVDARRLADVLSGKAVFTKRQFRREVERVTNETRNMTEGRPGGILGWRARAIVHPNEPEGRQGIGIVSELAELTLDDVRRQYVVSHRPERADLIVVGHVDPKLDLPFYEQVFGKISAPKASKVPAPPKGPAVIPPAVTEYRSVAAVYGSLAIAAPAPGDPDFPAFVVGALWLAQRANLSFKMRGRETEAAFLPGMYPLLEAPGTVMLNRRGTDKQSRADVEKELRDWLAAQLKIRIPDQTLVFQRRQLSMLLDPLPRSKARTRMLAHQPRLLYGVGLARGATKLDGFPDDLWAKIQALDGKTVTAALKRWCGDDKPKFVGLTPKPRPGKSR